MAESSRRRSVRIQQKVASESELSDLNTDDESRISSAKKKSRRTPLRNESNSKVSRRDKVPSTVPEDTDCDDVESLKSQPKDVTPKKNVTHSSKKKPSSATKTKGNVAVKSSRKAKRKLLEDTIPEFIELDNANTFCQSALADLIDNVVNKENKLANKSVTEKDEDFIKVEPDESDKVKTKFKPIISKDRVEKNHLNLSSAKVTEEPCGILKSSKSKFKFNFQRYGGIHNDHSSLSKLSIQLENDKQLQSHFQQLKNKSVKKGTTNLPLTDVFGLDGMNITKSEKEEPKIKTKLSNMASSSASFSKKILEKEVSQLMKKSVLPPDMEKNKSCPKFHESKIAKEKEKKKKAQETTGPGWYNMPRTELTDEVKRDLQIIKMRGTLDNKRHYKRSDSKVFPKFFQMGTIVEGAHDFYSSRLSKKDRKRTMVDELLADAEFRKKNKQRMIDYERKKQSGGKDYYKKKMEKRKRVK